MARYITKRLLALVPVLLIVAVIVFVLMRLLPGNPAAMMLGPEATTEEIEQLAEQMGLKEPILKQITEWFRNVIKGDLGKSIFLRMPVTKAIYQHLEATLLLTLLALVVAVTVGISAGVIAAAWHNSLLDQLIMSLSTLGVAIPVFWLGLMLILKVALPSSFFPVAGYAPVARYGMGASMRYLILPAISLSAGQAAAIARMTRANMLEVLQSDYVRTAKAKGASGLAVTFKHALKNAIIPTVTVIGLCFANLMGGAVVTEQIFNIPGIGRLLITAVFRRDYPLISGIVLYIASAYVLINLVIDIMYAFLDPRIRF